MWVPLPTDMSKYLYHSPMMLLQDTVETPVNSRLNLLQQRKGKDQIYGQKDYPIVPTLYNPWGKSYMDFMGYPKTGPFLPIFQADI